MSKVLNVGAHLAALGSSNMFLILIIRWLCTGVTFAKAIYFMPYCLLLIYYNLPYDPR